MLRIFRLLFTFTGFVFLFGAIAYPEWSSLDERLTYIRLAICMIVICQPRATFRCLRWLWNLSRHLFSSLNGSNEKQYETINQSLRSNTTQHSVEDTAFRFSYNCDTTEEEFLTAAMDYITATGVASVSTLQRGLKIGYARAARILDTLEEYGYVGPFAGTNPRDILITPKEWNSIKADPSHSPFEQKEAPNTDLIEDTIFCTTEEQANEFYRSHLLVDELYTKVVGTTYANDDGSSRQEALSLCKAGDGVLFQPWTFEGEPAVAVISEHGQIGNLPAYLADKFENGYEYDLIISGTITEITGGTNGRNYGCNLFIQLYKA